MRITREGYVPRWAVGGPASGVVISDPASFTPALVGGDLTAVIQEILNLMTGGSTGRWELAVIPGSPPDPLYADGDFLYIFVP